MFVDGDVNEIYPGVPENIRGFIAHMGFAEVAAEGHRELLEENAMQGACITCSGELKDNTILVFDASGIIAAYCGAACFQDMNVLHFLAETHSDIQDQVKFRGGQGDEPEEEPA